MSRRHSRRRRSSDDHKPRVRLSPWAIVSIAFLLAALLVFLGFLHIDKTVLTGILTLVSLCGFIAGVVAEKQISRRMGLMQGDGAALVGKWANLGIFLLSTLYFVWSVTMALYGNGLI